MSTVSTRTLAALAFERGEEFDPALTLPSTPLAEDLALVADARALLCQASPAQRRRLRQRARDDTRAGRRSALAGGESWQPGRRSEAA